MKKINFLLIVTLLFGFLSCNKNAASSGAGVSLKTQEDSLNYCYGLLYGGDIRNNVLGKDTTDADINTLMSQLDKEVGRNVENKYENNGYYFGKNLKQQQSKGLGLLGDSLSKMDYELLKKGLINGMKDHKEGMTVEQAMEYFQATAQKIQMRQMQKQAPAMPPANEHAGHDHATEAQPDSLKK